MIQLNRDLTERQARALLRKFRDLNLGPCGLELASGERVRIAGCASLDHPVELGVSYCLERAAGGELLGIQWRAGRLALTLGPLRAGDAVRGRSFEIDLRCDPHGRVTAPEIGARLDLEHAAARDVEHFLRRVVRAACDERWLPG